MAIIEHREVVAPQARDLQQVLCAVDGGRAGNAALHQAIALAPCATQLRFISVIAPAEHARPLGERRAQRALEHARTVALTYGIRAEADLLQGDDPAALLLAHESAAMVLVAGIHGGSRAAGAVTGSVATALAHRAVGPVLLAREGGASHDVPRRILVAVDDDAIARPAARLAGTIAARCGGYVHLVHVRRRDYGTRTRHRLALLATDLMELTGAEPMIDVLQGSRVAAQVSDLAQRHSSSLLVVGRGGPTGLRALGSVSERLVHTAPCSVLVVPGSPARK
jgi:nucleotide-binding universal stress UspA family protein